MPMLYICTEREVPRARMRRMDGCASCKIIVLNGWLYVVLLNYVTTTNR